MYNTLTRIDWREVNGVSRKGPHIHTRVCTMRRWNNTHTHTTYFCCCCFSNIAYRWNRRMWESKMLKNKTNNRDSRRPFLFLLRWSVHTHHTVFNSLAFNTIVQSQVTVSQPASHMKRIGCSIPCNACISAGSMHTCKSWDAMHSAKQQYSYKM